MKDKSLILIIALLIISVISFRQNYYLVKENKSLKDDLEQYQDALDDANTIIEEAKTHAWKNYEEMGLALESMQTVDVSGAFGLPTLPSLLPSLPKLPSLPSLP